MKIRLLGAELFHADRRTDGHDEATETVYNAVRSGYLNKTVHASNLNGYYNTATPFYAIEYEALIACQRIRTVNLTQKDFIRPYCRHAQLYLHREPWVTKLGFLKPIT